MLGHNFGAATAYPKARGICDDERGGTLVEDEPVLIHCYTTPDDIQDTANLQELGRFCRRMGRVRRSLRSRARLRSPLPVPLHVSDICFDDSRLPYACVRFFFFE